MFQSDGNYPQSEHLERFGRDIAEDELRYRAAVVVRSRLKGIVERFANSFLDARFTIQRYRSSQVKLEQPQVVEPKQVIGVFVRKENGMHDADFFAQKLCP